MAAVPTILMIAPSALPRRSPEAIQVDRVLTALSAKAKGMLVTAPPETSGWAKAFSATYPHYANFERLELRLPLHHLTCRVLNSHYLRRFLAFDPQFWIPHQDRYILRQLKQKPDVIYSRSNPVSAALLARKLKQHLQIPWVMHLSDPWSDNPYLQASTHSVRDEACCFAQADLITLTTPGQVAFYQQKYPEHAVKIVEFPNVMPLDADSTRFTRPEDHQLHLVYAGNLYGERTPAPLVAALKHMLTQRPDLTARIRLDVYGLAQPHCLAMLSELPQVIHYHGPVNAEAALEAQASSDLIVCLEPEIDSPLAPFFLPSKVPDSLALGRKMFALTPAGSETAKICAADYGYAFTPSATQAIAAQLIELVEQLVQFRQAGTKPRPEKYRAEVAVETLLARMHELR